MALDPVRLALKEVSNLPDYEEPLFDPGLTNPVASLPLLEVGLNILFELYGLSKLVPTLAVYCTF